MNPGSKYSNSFSTLLQVGKYLTIGLPNLTTGPSFRSGNHTIDPKDNDDRSEVRRTTSFLLVVLHCFVCQAEIPLKLAIMYHFT